MICFFEIMYQINLSLYHYLFLTQELHKKLVGPSCVLRLWNCHRLQLSASRTENGCRSSTGVKRQSSRRGFDCEPQLERETQKRLGG